MSASLGGDSRVFRNGMPENHLCGCSLPYSEKCHCSGLRDDSNDSVIGFIRNTPSPL